MDRVELRTARGALAERVPGGFVLDAEQEWLVEGPAPQLDEVQAAVGRSARRLSAQLLRLEFGNAVGRYRAGPLGTLRVRSGKWEERHFAAMLTDIAAWSAALPFAVDTPSGLPQDRSNPDEPEVLYHSFCWLRHALLEDAEAALPGALRSILRSPHSRLEAEESLVSSDRSVRTGPRALEELATGKRPLFRVARGSGLAGTDLFPREVAEVRHRIALDTAENRFVLSFLHACQRVVEGIEALLERELSSSTKLREDCLALEGELAHVLRHRMWSEVGTMRFFPGSSSVLQRRGDYREVLRHDVLLRTGSRALPLDPLAARDLLEAKDIARLYEIWAFFAVLSVLQEEKGPPLEARPVKHDAFEASLGRGLVVAWPDRTELAYNASFSARRGFHGTSWALELRPDVSLWIPSGAGAGLHLFDAKFRNAPPGTEAGGLLQAKAEDLHKMHVYRDAIPAARSAWVLFPGESFQAWGMPGGRLPHASGLEAGFRGIGAVPLLPGSSTSLLAEVVGRLLAA